MGAPHFQGCPYIVIVQLDEILQTVGVVIEFRWINIIVKEKAQCCFESADLLMNGFDTLRTLCVDGITANEEKCRRDVHNSIGVVTALNPVIGYKNSTKIAKEALETGKGVYELVLEHNILSKKDLDTILKPENMIKPVKLDIHPNR